MGQKRKNNMTEQPTKQTSEQLHELILAELRVIREQTILTNSRVKNLELWRAFITGGLTIVGIMIVPILIKMFAI